MKGSVAGWLGMVFLFRSASVFSATLPQGFAESDVAIEIPNPTAMDFAPDGRLFVCQQTGQLRVIKGSTLLSDPFVTVDTDSNGERGLLGIAFDPGFATNRFLYVYYTATAPSVHNRVSRFTANGDLAVQGSEQPILDLEDLTSTSHNAGAIHFGADGLLYVAVGENTTPSNAQTLTNRLGKILRINRDGSIPASNPFFNVASGVNRAIWALGLRNPFTFAVENRTGRIFINDVGESSVEEINEGIAGANYGWPSCEGACMPRNPMFVDPVFQYGHGSSSTTGGAITGGAFYTPTVQQFPASYQGRYFFADTSSGWIRQFDPNTGNATGFATDIAGPVDLKVSADGFLYYLSRGGSANVRRIAYTNGLPALHISRFGTEISVFWSALFVGFQPESTSALGPDAIWSPVDEPVTEINDEKRIAISAIGNTRFFRLVKR
jgi:glucose/arabinose dehydrogenase